MLGAPTRSHLRRRRAGRYLALLLVITATTAAAPEPPIPKLQPPAEQEPITPVPPPPPADPLKLALGEHLFADPRLSADGSRACTSCHDIRTNGADSKRHDEAVDGSELPLHTSSVFNAALSFRLNWEGNFRTLEAQAEAVLENQQTMGRSIDEVLGKLSADPQTRRQFGAAQTTHSESPKSSTRETPAFAEAWFYPVGAERSSRNRSRRCRLIRYPPAILVQQ